MKINFDKKPIDDKSVNEIIEYDARVGRDAIKLLINDGLMEVEDMIDESDSESAYTCTITNIKSLLDWAENN